MSPVRLFPFLLAGLFGTSIALQDEQIQPESWCITYLSTYLVPVSRGYPRPTTVSAGGSIFSEISETPLTFSTDLAIPSTLSVPDDVIVTTSISSQTTGIPIPEASGRSVILRVVPESQDTKRDLQARAVRGFVGSQSEICADATIFNLVQGRLLDGTLPIYYNGESFKELLGNPEASSQGAVTETFADEDGFLRFFNSALPNGQAGFCQDTESGQVYVTFTASPPGCQTIRLFIIEVDECRDGYVPSSTSSRAASTSLLSESTSVSLGTTSPSNAAPSTTTKDTQMAASATDVPTFTSHVVPVFTSSMRFYNSSSSIISATQPGLTQTFSTLDISTSVTDLPLTSPLSSWTPDPESLSTDAPSTDALSTDALSTDVSGTSDELASTFEPSTTATPTITLTPTTTDSQITSVTSSGTDSTASSDVDSSTTSGSSYSLETDTSTLPDLPLDTSSSFDASSTVLPTAETSLFTTTAADATTSTTTSSEPTRTRACPEGLSDPLTLFNGERPSDNGVEWLVLPFQVPLYGATSEMIYVSPNGLVTLRDSLGADSVPDLAFLPDENIESLAIFPYWIDMIVPEDSGAEVTYQVEQTPNQPGVLTIDWCVFTTSDETAPNHFQMVISEDQQTPITFFYYTIQPGGTIATIGAQNRETDQWVQYYGAIPDRTFMEVDTFGDGDIRTGQF
ncbi:uncharacterized protein FIESC28_10775 [Fusarium coffeatum]|uniref:DUF7908 domain-containing protein n=1 Tax=Fusarium coffeatum TaxID=231269 RepID=A0A366QT13_9HYPO|nr:uncharacterized protein FIESC28_10775 [Fusarium coffeatum]RBR07276.1 hypothetical protein FIESC28_10775 [Fusarium coffeatum]